jgi:hypothetical protein
MITWYDRAVLGGDDISQEAGMRETVLSSILGAIVMIMGGTKMSDAIARWMVDKEDVERAVHDPKILGMAKEIRDRAGTVNTVDQLEDLIKSIEQDTLRLKRENEERARKSHEEGKKQDRRQPYGYSSKPTVSSELIDVVISLEHDPRRDISSKGARGLMQLMKPAWDDMNNKFFGGKYPYEQYALNDHVNKMFGSKYLSYIKERLQQYKHLWRTDEESLILACYHGGLGNIMKAKFDPRILKKKMPLTYSYMIRGKSRLGKM